MHLITNNVIKIGQFLRGNYYSRRHANLSIDSSEFWDFT